ncbi:MAG: GTP cyclohydrolase II [Parcubacteria group bacterium]|jgi:3,4-dihydroxy 2-butanone 4-phosphate synthase/GTP cyclohydrolase II
MKSAKAVKVKVIAKAKLPSKYGNFIIYAFRKNLDGKEHLAIVKGEVANQENVPLRIHSECLTGDALGSLRCDCGDQLRKSLKHIDKKGKGVVIYLRQEGRGIGLNNKIKAYALQDKGLDTYDANVKLGFKPDERTYEIANAIIRVLKIKSVLLMTNNPEKIKALNESHIRIKKIIKHCGETNDFNRRYLKTKKTKFKHLL